MAMEPSVIIPMAEAAALEGATSAFYPTARSPRLDD